MRFCRLQCVHLGVRQAHPTILGRTTTQKHGVASKVFVMTVERPQPECLSRGACLTGHSSPQTLLQPRSVSCRCAVVGKLLCAIPRVDKRR